jgi:hypothetical protein
MDRKALGRAMLEAKRFLKKADEAILRRVKDHQFGFTFGGTKETAALKRASMDLSRALSALRSRKEEG